jgi:DNA-binding MarR family transcriptional regulator
MRIEYKNAFDRAKRELAKGSNQQFHEQVDGDEVNGPEATDLDNAVFRAHSPEAIDPTRIDPDELREEVADNSGRYDERAVSRTSQSFDPFQETEDLMFFEDLVEGLVYEGKEREDLLSELDERHGEAERRFEELKESGYVDDDNRPMTQAAEVYNLAQRLERFHKQEIATEINSRAGQMLDDLGKELGYQGLSERFDEMPADEAPANAKHRVAETFDLLSKRKYRDRPENKIQILMEVERTGPATAEEIQKETTYNRRAHVKAQAGKLENDGLIEKEGDSYGLTGKGEVIAEAVTDLYATESMLAE